jgi:NAD(P)-dependent dehydrogenase (short-subunit alcohol dehydrogenase family)
MAAKVLVIDGQGGGLGRQLVSALAAACPEAELTAVGTNSLAANAMLKAGASRAATGENAVVVNCRHADVIVGPIGIVIADALLGEITPAMAAAVCQSGAKRVLVPINHCENYVVGVPDQPVSQLVAAAAQKVKELCSAIG